MAIVTRVGPLLLLMTLATGGLVGCASGTPSGAASSSIPPTSVQAPGSASAATTPTTTGVSTTVGAARSVNGEVASLEFVAAALTGDAASFLASSPLDDPQRGAPYDPAALTGRLPELATLAGTPAPSATAYPGRGLGPACDDAAGLVCQIDLTGAPGAVTTTVVVHWLDDGVSDFVVVPRAPDGAPHGIGRLTCTAGRSLIHGGHAVDRFDIALCADPAGNLEYNGIERGTDRSITIPACARGPAVFEATNDGFTYVIDGSASPSRTRLQVINPQGQVRIDTFLTDVRFPPAAALTPC